MKFKIFRLFALLFVVMSLSSCYMGRWRRYNQRDHYIHKKKYKKLHKHHSKRW
ncbi:MAG: hypothetical protein V4649_12050 [Bacteroidota bacterium]